MTLGPLGCSGMLWVLQVSAFLPYKLCMRVVNLPFGPAWLDLIGRGRLVYGGGQVTPTRSDVSAVPSTVQYEWVAVVLIWRGSSNLLDEAAGGGNKLCVPERRAVGRSR